MLVFAVLMQFFMLRTLLMSARSWGQAFQNIHEALDEEEARDVSALGQSWPSFVPRIDYGAYRHKNRDAEALCLIGREKLSEKDFKILRCN
jgi:hypothetical protein